MSLRRELAEFSRADHEPDEEDFDAPLEQQARYERFKQTAKLNIACELAALRFGETTDQAECERIAKTLQEDVGKAFDLSLERMRDGELKSLRRELAEAQEDEEGGRAAEAEELMREIERIGKRLKEREKNRDAIIYRRFYELIEDEDPYAWE